jgi:hypothetical protein
MGVRFQHHPIGALLYLTGATEDAKGKAVTTRAAAAMNARREIE